ncbi:SDR family NAD(P)-dependent oxidoreductase [Streptomyces paludis]|uniref:SDR family NAD(P)-dependent oxidoreductase n=1 Tax=Streptomyces paludis TaxID=2282738 RepID=A0A345HY47_9ACTN|nr:SDR family NAD(P)-dependent oxidoreductase [Streptomyces paludis]AXG81621.1 SDR family NAD(P)-dependent oxidoreductase [Streptomyces paludis]
MSTARREATLPHTADPDPDPSTDADSGARTDAGVGAPAGADVPDRPAAPDGPLLDRHVLLLAPAPGPDATTTADAGPPDLFPPGTVLLANTTDRMPGVEVLPADALPDDTSGAASDDPLEAAVAQIRPRHVRVLVDLYAEPPTPSEALLALHDALFRTAKACAAPGLRPESFVVVVLGGVDGARVPHACAGLFTGFVKSLAREWPDTAVLAVVHEARDLVTAEPDAARETVAGPFPPVVYYAGGTRLLWRAVADPGAPAGVAPAPGERCVVAAGGAHGIGAALLLALARRDRPRLHIIGSTPLDGDGYEGEESGEADVRPERKDFVRALTTGPERLTVREATMAYDRLGTARRIRANLAELRRLCGAHRVTYHVCDLRDRAAVEAVVRRVTDEEGTVDLLLHIAGTNRAASVGRKRPRDFRAVRDLKVRSYAHLKAAFGDRQPRLWCNFGSFVGFTGQTGETDYAAANDYLNTAALYHCAHGAREFTLGWTLWRDIGLGATPLMRALLAKSGRFTAMPTAEGVDHFLRELDLREPGPRETGHPAQPPPVTVLFGAAERAALGTAAP